MKRYLPFFLLALSAAAAEPLREGDIIFHTSKSAQSRAIQAATHSPYSHMGILFRQRGRWLVYEAVQPVKMTPFDAWTARGDGGHYVVKRWRKPLTPAVLARMRNVAKSLAGKRYDLTFEWSDEKMYCSELVWKIYKRAAGVEIGRLQRLRDFDLTGPEVRAKMQERYHGHPPLDEPVISPAAMFNSAELVEVVRR